MDTELVIAQEGRLEDRIQDPLLTHESSLRRVLRQSAKQALIGVAVMCVLIGIWEAVDRIYSLPATELPTPLETWTALHRYFRYLMHNASPTAEEAGLGFLLSAILGIPLGWVLARPGKITTAIKTVVLSAQIFPKVVIAPLLIIWFGFGYLPRFIFVILLCFFPIAMNAAAGFSSMPLELGELAQIVGLGPIQRLVRLQGPWALPQIFTGLKVSSTFAVIAAIVYEFVGGQSGLGVVIIDSQTNVNVALMFAAVILIAVLGFIFYGIIVALEYLAIPWHVSRRRL